MIKGSYKMFGFLILLCTNLNVLSQADSSHKVLFGVGVQGRVQGTYFTEMFIRPHEMIQVHGIYGKTTVSPNINNFRQSTISGNYWGAGFSGVFFQGEKLFPNFRKSPTTAVSIGARYVLGDMNFEGKRIVPSSVYNDFEAVIEAKDLRFIYIEFFTTIEIMIGNRVKLDIMPIMLKHAQVESFKEATVRYNPLGGRSANLRPSLGMGLYYYFRVKTNKYE